MMIECVIDENDPLYANIFHAPMLSTAEASTSNARRTSPTWVTFTTTDREFQVQINKCFNEN